MQEVRNTGGEIWQVYVSEKRQRPVIGRFPGTEDKKIRVSYILFTR